MGSSIHRNADKHSGSGILIESDDDDPGIRGLSSSIQRKNKPGNRSRADIDTDPLDAAFINQREHSNDNFALKLDQMVLGKTGVATEFAQGSISRPGNALSSLKGVATSIPHAPSSPSSVSDAGSPGSLTWASSSSSSSGSDSDSSSTASGTVSAASLSRPTVCSDEIVDLPLKRMIRAVCISGLESSNSHRRPFCLDSTKIRAVCTRVREQFLSEPSLLRLEGPVKIVGDIHGQFRDLMRVFKLGGMPPSVQYLFLGDYVDRGKQSLETIMLLLMLKLRYPDRVHMLRGNHESASVTKVYGFYDECKRRSSVKVWRAIVDVFNCLPVAATINNRIFCVHGGLSPQLTSLDQITAVQRPTDVPEAGLVSDLLWSDPDSQVKEWSDNDRGVSYCFGRASLDRFCRKFGIDLVVRGHMVVEDGYEFFGDRKLVTVFSAPNYCGDFDNYGAVMNVDEKLLCSFDVLEPKHRKHTVLASDTRVPSSVSNVAIKSQDRSVEV